MELHDKYPSAARSELHSDLWVPALVIACGALVLGGLAAVNGTGWARTAGIATGAALLVLAHSLWRLRAWARWTLVIGIGGMLVAAAITRIVRWESPTGAELIQIAFGGLYWGALVLYLASPQVTRMFELANSEWEPRASRRGSTPDEGSEPPRESASHP